MKWEIDTKLIINLYQKAKTGFAVDEMIFGQKTARVPEATFTCINTN